MYRLLDGNKSFENNDDLIKNIESLTKNLQPIKFDVKVKQMEFNIVWKIFNEKSRENSLLKEDKKIYIEKLAKLEQDKQEQPSIVYQESLSYEKKKFEEVDLVLSQCDSSISSISSDIVRVNLDSLC